MRSIDLNGKNEQTEGRIGANAVPHERVYQLDLKSQDALALTLPNGDAGKLTAVQYIVSLRCASSSLLCSLSGCLRCYSLIFSNPVLSLAWLFGINGFDDYD